MIIRLSTSATERGALAAVAAGLAGAYASNSLEQSDRALDAATKMGQVRGIARRLHNRLLCPAQAMGPSEKSRPNALDLT